MIVKVLGKGAIVSVASLYVPQCGLEIFGKNELVVVASMNMFEALQKITGKIRVMVLGLEIRKIKLL